MGETQKSPKSMTGHAFSQFELLNAFVKNLKHFKLTPNTKWVIAELITHFNPKNAYIFPKQKTIADNIGISEASVIRAISQLHKDGLIISERKYTNRYIFTPKFLNLCGLSEKNFTSHKMRVENKQIECKKLANCNLHEHEQKNKPIKEHTIRAVVVSKKKSFPHTITLDDIPNIIKKNKKIKEPCAYWVSLSEDAKKYYWEKEEKQQKIKMGKKQNKENRTQTETKRIEEEKPLNEDYTYETACVFIKNVAKFNKSYAYQGLSKRLVETFKINVDELL